MITCWRRPDWFSGRYTGLRAGVSLGANPVSRVFYLRVKGEVEKELGALAFPSLIMIRPSLLVGGPRASARPLEALGLFIARLTSACYRAAPRRDHSSSGAKPVPGLPGSAPWSSYHRVG
jgi:uncharacterized protein YbjT (DUF2867 family)